MRRTFPRIRQWLAAGAMLAAAVGLSTPAAAAPAEAPVIGAYLWGGLLGGERSPAAFERSVAFLLDKGFTAVRFAVGPKTLDGYGIAPGSCGAKPGLACMLKPFLAGAALDDPRLRTVMITLHDRVVTGPDGFDPAAVAASRDAIRADHLEAFALLEQRFAGRPVRVVISNWEGDNLVYCGGAYRFARDAAFAQSCAVTRGKGFANAIDGMLDWAAVRDEAIAEHRARGGRLDLRQAIEINNLQIFRDSCLTACDVGLTLAARMQARGGVELCSYSAYDAVNVGALGPALDRLAQVCRRIIVGEVGLSLDRVKGERLERLYASAASAIEAHRTVVETVFIWNAFEDAATKDRGYGLFRADGSPFAFAHWPERWRLAVQPRRSIPRRRITRRRATSKA